MTTSSALIFDAEQFEKVICESSVPVVVEFWSEWCAPCRTYGVVIDELALEIGEAAIIAKVSVTDHPDACERHQVSSVPTTLIFDNGQLVRRLSGPRPLTHLRREIAACSTFAGAETPHPDLKDEEPHGHN